MAKWKDKEASIRALENGGKVDPKDLIEAARDESHPCHGDFTWDVDEAAAERWHDQARKLIRQVKFEVKTEHVGVRVVAYVPSPDGDATFRSWPKTRSPTIVSNSLTAEIAQLYGNAARVYGMALSKEGIVGAEIVIQLAAIRDQLADMKESMNE